MSEAGRRVFAYAGGRTVFRGALASLTCGGCAMSLLFAAIAAPQFIAAAIVLAFFAWFFTSLFLLERPIALDEEQIDSLLGHWRWRTIAWRDVDRIEKRVAPEHVDGEGAVFARSEQIFFRSGRRSILVTSAIEGFEALKQRVTEKAKRRGIEFMLAEPQPLWHAPILTPLDEL